MYLKNNSGYWIQVADGGKIIKIKNKKEATNFGDTNKIKAVLMRCRKKLKGYYAVDENGKKVKEKDNRAFERHDENGKRKTFSSEERDKVYKRSFGKCYICGRPLMKHEFTIDHKKPLSMNGSNRMANLYCACSMCNTMKANYDWDDFLNQIRRIYKYQKRKRFVLKIKKLIYRIKQKGA